MYHSYEPIENVKIFSLCTILMSLLKMPCLCLQIMPYCLCLLIIVGHYSIQNIYQIYQSCLLFMGSLGSTPQQLAEIKARDIKEQLYHRINRSKVLYQRAFDQISVQNKNIIKRSTATELADMMDGKIITAVEVLLTFIERVCTIGIENNYVMDEMFEDSLEIARQVDQKRSKHPKMKCWREDRNKQDCFPPFFGVPISIKDSLLMKGRQSYIGHVYPVNKIPEENPIFILMILKMGFIPFVRSTVPQACKTSQTNNNIFGYAKNPWNKNRSCGGSSGGEGGLVAAGCSPIGIGTDLAGSCRIPAEWNGLVALKAANRYSSKGNAYYGSYSAGGPIKSEVGPIAKSVQDFILFSHFMYDRQNYQNIPPSQIDPYMTLLPFRNEVFEQRPRLKIGYFTHIKGHVNCSKSHERAVHKVIHILKDLGHETVEVQIPGFQDLFLCLARLWTGDSELTILKELRKGEKSIPEYNLINLLARIPWLLKVIIALLIKKIQPRLSRIILNAKPLNSKEIAHLVYNNQVSRERQIYSYLTEQEIDIVIHPGYAIPAPLLGYAHKLSYIATYPTPWNIIHYPAGVLPITVVQNSEQNYTDKFNDVYTKTAKKMMENSEGLPVGIHVASYPNNEQRILYIMQQIEKKVQFRENHESFSMKS